MGNNAPPRGHGFLQGIFEISATALHTLGTKRETDDGRIFRYAKAGASALAAGKMGVAAAIVAAHTNQTAVAVAIGDTQMTLSVTAGTAIAENQLAGGYLHINDATGEGYQYPIVSNTAIGAGDTDITITIAEPGIKIALTTSSEFTLVHSPWYGVTESTTEESLPVGIAPMVVTAAYYYWAQTGGPAIALTAGTPAVGTMLTLSSTAGALAAINATLDIDQPICAKTWGTAGVDTEYKPVYLLID